MHNSALTNPPIITKKNFNCTMQAWEKNLDGKLAMMVSTINLDIDKCVEVTIDILKFQTPSTTIAIGATVMEFQLLNQRLQAI